MIVARLGNLSWARSKLRGNSGLVNSIAQDLESARPEVDNRIVISSTFIEGRSRASLSPQHITFINLHLHILIGNRQQWREAWVVLSEAIGLSCWQAPTAPHTLNSAGFQP